MDRILKRPLSLYIHIPFCIKKCAYCDFLSAPASAAIQKEYVKALKCEIAAEAESGAGYEVVSVFFGGGTPSILETGEIKGILKTISNVFCLRQNAEITVECNPGTLDKEKLCSYQQAGVNRLSIGLQSADNKELKEIGRIHTWEDFLHSYDMAREQGFANINVDLISALPGQSLASYENTLKKVIALQPEHISAYSLIIEEGTPFYKRYKQETNAEEKAAYSPLPDEETERQMYKRTAELLGQAGYVRYEISNYAKKGRECQHNIVYWKRGEYLGFGLGAASFFQGNRFLRERELKEYLQLIKTGKQTKREIQKLDETDAMEEFMFLGLRMIRGIKKEEFKKEFGRDINQIYKKVLEKYKRTGLLEEKDGWLRLTERGIDVSNVIFADFILLD